MTDATNAYVPGISHSIRDRALKILDTKKYLAEKRDLLPYVDTMPGDEILSLAPASYVDLAQRYPHRSPNNSVLEWERFCYSYREFMKKELDEWATRVIDKARKQFETNGPMQRSLMG